MKVLKWIGGCLLVLALFIGAFGLEFIGVEWYGFIAPRRAAVRREVFENTESYVAGVATDIAKSRREYLMSEDDAEKRIIANYVFVQYANFEPSKLQNHELRNFLRDVQNGRLPR